MAWRGLGGFNPRQKRNSVSGGEQKNSLREALRARGGAQNVVPAAATDVEDNFPEKGIAANPNLNLEWLNLQAFAPKALQNVVDKIRAGELPTVLRRGNDTDGEDPAAAEAAAMSSESEAAESQVSSQPGRRLEPGRRHSTGGSSGLRSALQARGGFRQAPAASSTASGSQETSGPDGGGTAAAVAADAADLPQHEGTLPTVASGSPLASVAEGEEAEEEQHFQRGLEDGEERKVSEASAAAGAGDADEAPEPESVAAQAEEEDRTAEELPPAVAAASEASPPAGFGTGSGQAEFEEFRPPPRRSEEAEVEASAVATVETEPAAAAAETVEPPTAAVAASAASLPAEEPAAAAAAAGGGSSAEEARLAEDSMAPAAAAEVVPASAAEAGTSGRLRLGQAEPTAAAPATSAREAQEASKSKGQLAHSPGASSRAGAGAKTVERVVPVVASATAFPLAMSSPTGSPRDDRDEQAPAAKPKLAAEPPRQPGATTLESRGKVKDMREFWGKNKNSRGFAGPQISKTSRLSRGEAEATLQRLLACGGDLDQVRSLRKELAELEA